MVDSIKTVAVLGASGTIGSLIGGLVAQNGIKAYFLSRRREGAERGLKKAIAQARSEIISRNIVCGDYEHLLESALAEADWVVEAVTEDLAIKRQVYEKVEQYKRPETIMSSTTSSLPLTALAQGRSESFKRNFLATHFYNPPGRMLACEITGQPDTDPRVFNLMKDFLAKKVRRVVVPVKNVAGFAGNRIAFLLFSRITSLAEEYGVEKTDYLIGPYTGRLMAPLATLDLVGLDVHRAIINNLNDSTNDEMRDCLILPDYINKMIDMGLLGNKTGGGFYKRLESGRHVFFDSEMCDYIPAIEPHVAFVEKAKHFIHMGMYKEAFDTIRSAHGSEADIVMDILCTYVAYSYSRIGEVTDPEHGIDEIDQVMSAGFHWAAPSVILHMLGGSEVVAESLHKRGVGVPDALNSELEPLLKIMDSGKYFIAR